MTKVSDFTALTGAGVDQANDLLEIVDMSETGDARNKKITVAELLGLINVTGLLDFKGSTDCSANPNYPAASKGDFYVVSVAGKIGGASGTVVEVGDAYFATADNAGGTQASVGTSWSVIQGNIVGGTINALDDIPDVNAPSPTAGDGLVWDDIAGEWVASPLPGGGAGGTVPDGGATGQVLTKDSGTDQDTSWQSPFAVTGAIVTKSTQTIATNNFTTTISFDTEVRDDGGFWSVGNPERLTAPSAGWYLVTASHGWATNTTNNRWLRIESRTSAGATIETVSNTYQPGTGIQEAALSGIFYLAAGDYVVMIPAQTSGGNLASTTNRLAILRLS